MSIQNNKGDSDAARRGLRPFLNKLLKSKWSTTTPVKKVCNLSFLLRMLLLPSDLSDFNNMVTPIEVEAYDILKYRSGACNDVRVKMPYV